MQGEPGSFRKPPSAEQRLFRRIRAKQLIAEKSTESTPSRPC